jgi:hypothetical protein
VFSASRYVRINFVLCVLKCLLYQDTLRTLGKLTRSECVSTVAMGRDPSVA